MVEGHCAKRYADDARQKCVGKRVVEIIWRADPRNDANVERCARGKRLVAVECISKQVFLRFADDTTTPAPTRKRSSSVVDLTADSDDELICRPKKRARSDEGVVDLTLDSDDEAPATPPLAPGTMLVELRFGIHGKIEVAATAKRTTPDFQFALRLDSGQFLLFVSPENPKTISSESFAKRSAEVGPKDLCGDAFRHGALVDSLEKAFRAAGTDRTAKAVVLQQWVAPGCGNIIANEGLHLARVDPTAKAASLGRAEADRLAYWLRAYAMRWYRDGNALQRYRLVDNRRPVDGCGECGLTRAQGGLVQSSCTAMGRGVKGFACAACLAKPPRPRGDPLAEKPGRGAWPRPRARVQAPPTAAAALLLPRGGDRGHTCAVPREKLVRCDFFSLKWRLQYKCDVSGCKARGNCDELFAPWPTCRCAATVTSTGIPRNAAAVTSNGTGARVGELFYSCRHRPSCEHFCGVGRRALANSGLPAAAQARLKADFGHIKPKNPPLPCCGSKKSKKPRAKK